MHLLPCCTIHLYINIVEIRGEGDNRGLSLSLLDKFGEPKLHVKQSIFQNRKMFLQDVCHILSSVYGVPCVGKILLHAGNDHKPQVNLLRFTHFHTIVHEIVSPQFITAQEVFLLIQRKQVAIISSKCVSARASSRPDVLTDDC